MNKGKVTKRRGSKPNINNDPNEVFVLPPNLLEKLGINLGRVGSTPELTVDHLVSDIKTISKDIDIGQKQHIIRNSSENYIKPLSQNESSIIETANLMKESLFLSPTFISNSTCAIQGEVEIVGNADLKNTRNSDINQDNNDDYSLCSNEMREDVDLNTVNISVTEKDLQNPINTKTLEFNENVDKEDHSKNALNRVDSVENDTSMEDNANKSCAFDYGTSNKGVIDKMETLHSSYLLQECGNNQNKNKKIRIISEKILDPAQVKEWVNCARNRSNVVPVMVNTLVKSHCSKSVSDQNYVGLKFNSSFNENPINEESDKTNQNCVSFNLCIDEDKNSNLKLNQALASPESNETSVDCKSISSKDSHETLMEIEGTCPGDKTKLSIDVVDEYKKEINSSMVISSNMYREDMSNKNKTNILHETSSNFFTSKSECNKNEVNATLEMVNSNVIQNDAYNNRLKTSTDVLPDVSTFEIRDKQNSKSIDDEMCSKGTKIAFSSKICLGDRITYKGLSQNEYNKFGFQFKQDDNEIKNKIKQSQQFSHIKPNNETKIVANESKTVALHKSTSFDTHNIKEQHEGQKNKAKVHKHDKRHLKVLPATIGTYHEMRSHNDTKLVQVENASAIQKDKVGEIAKYLSEFADMQRRKSVDEKHNRKQGNSSKLSIQGVEKPGGAKSNNFYRNGQFNNLKTYRKPKTTPTIKANQIESNVPRNVYLYDKKIDLVIETDKSFVNVCYEQEFCLCDDFGRLVSYDDCCQYEHIHFWKENNIECTRDDVFSIYDEGILEHACEYKETDISIDDSKYISNAFSTCTDRKLCWNEINAGVNKSPLQEYKCDEIIEIRFNKSTKEHSLNEEISEETAVCNGIQSTSNKIQRDNKNLTRDPVVNSSTCNKVNLESDEDLTRNGKKRKWSTHLDECEESPKKKIRRQNSILESDKITEAPVVAEDEHVTADVGGGITTSTLSRKASISTCGVCRRDIQDTDWLQHIASEHNYICWKVGQCALDLDNREMVVQHLSTIVKQIGELHCNNCGLTRKYAKAFLHHIKQCGVDKFSQDESTLNNSSDKFNAAVVESVKPEIGSTSNVATENKALSVDKCIKCGVCGESVHDKDWYSHIEAQHNYLAWKCGEPILDLDDDDAVKDHLNAITKQCGGLRCSKCGRVRKYVKSYLTHFKNCDGLSESLNESALNVTSDLPELKSERPVRVLVSDVNDETAAPGDDAVTKCGVCEETMPSEHWNSHRELKHDYLAWKRGEQALDINDEEAVKDHLYNITKECGGLKCSKCGLTRKYVKSYLTHFKSCNGPSESDSRSSVPDKTVTLPVGDGPSKCGVCGEHVEDKEWNSHLELRHNYLAWKLGEPVLESLNESALNVTSDLPELKSERPVRVLVSDVNDETAAPGDDAVTKCGVCEETMPSEHWNSHRELKHDYLAWKRGEQALDINDEEAVKDHLYNITKECGGLKCSKCGLTRKYVKSYLTHFKSCNGPSESDSRSSVPDKTVTLPVGDGPSKCGVCGEHVEDKEWNSHLEVRHNYLAWKLGEPVLDVGDENAVKEHLHAIAKECGGLKCAKCGLQRKYVKSYLTHIDSCNGLESEDENSLTNPEPGFPEVQCDGAQGSPASAGQVGCGVCGEEVPLGGWIAHIADKHEYLAWKNGEPSLNVHKKKEVYQHLCNIIKQSGALYCKKCGKKRKVVNNYLDHIQICGQDVSTTKDTTFEEEDSTLDLTDSCIDFDSGGTCGVCQSEVEPGKWIQHIQKHHNYLAWRRDEKPWNLDDFPEVNENLYAICKKMGGLTCNKCGLVRKYVKTYLTHIKNCSVIDFNINSIESEGPVSDQANYRCAMCQEEVKPSKWKDHAMRKHYNITWVIGETPIDLKNPYAIERYLKEYRQASNNLQCRTCGATRASNAGFFAHVIACGKTEEETEMFKSVCEICNNKYLGIYKHQHMMIHKVQDHSKELKLEKDGNNASREEEVNVSGKRRAAQKARSVIENYKNDSSQHPYKCESCRFGSDFKEELQSHTCAKSNDSEFSGDDSSEADVGESEDESLESEVNSDISMAENEEPKKKGQDRIRIRGPVPSKVSRLSFKVDKPKAYLLESDQDFCNGYLTDETLFPQWQSCEREVVSENELFKYLPSMENSCKVKSGFNWTTLKKFEVKAGNGVVMFVGGCIICLKWVPLRVGDTPNDHNFLAVACHKGVDSPRVQCDETLRHEGLIQIWDFRECKGLPKIVYGIAHNLGTVWSVDWCPSGARDIRPANLEHGKTRRLGLLAAACSSGSAYIFSVPYPATVVKDNKFVEKLKPVAELRMTMTTDRKLYQATSVTWSKQKGHSIVLVGYGDGSLAYYDLNCASPLLKKVEDNVEVFYPYHDERPHNTCVLGTDLFPGWGAAGAAGAAASTGATGAQLAAGAARVRSQLAAHAVAFAPHWPGALLAGDLTIMNTAVNELEWAAPARRLSGARALAGCARCGLLALAAPPALRALRPHPAYPDYRKQVVGTLEMTPLGSKRRKQVNDELGIKLEPLTYDDAIAKYGIEFTTIKKDDKEAQHKGGAKPRTHCPDRFPLADVTSMAFCPSKKHHDKLAVATHAGLIFFMKVDT